MGHIRGQDRAVALLLTAVGAVAMGDGAWCRAETLRLEVTRDTWVSEYHGASADERHANLGGDTRIKLKGIQELGIIDIDPAPLRGRVIRAAQLHVKTVGPERLWRVTVSSLASPWVEGTGRGYQRQIGSASFAQTQEGKRDWAEIGSDLTFVFGGMGHTVWSSAPAQGPDAQGWWTIAVDPAVVAARVAGVSHGFVVMDDVGTEYVRDGDKLNIRVFPNRYIASHEANAGRPWGSGDGPYFTVDVADGRDTSPLGAVTDLQGHVARGMDQPPAGTATWSWVTPGDAPVPGGAGGGASAGVAGFFVRWSALEKPDWDTMQAVPAYVIPRPGAVGDQVTMTWQPPEVEAGAPVTLAVRAVDGAGNMGPITSVRTPTSDLTLPVTPGPLVRAGSRTLGPDVAATNHGPTLLPAVTVPTIVPLWAKVNISDGTAASADIGGDWTDNPAIGADGTIHLSAARGETVAVQLVLPNDVVSPGPTTKDTAAGAATNAATTATLDAQWTWTSPAATRQGEPQGHWYRLDAIPTAKGPRPDPAVPVTMPVKLAAPALRTACTAWLAEVTIPKDVPAGDWHGQLTLRTPSLTHTWPVVLRVWRFALPDQLTFVPEMNCYGSTLPGPPQEVAYYRLAQLHRVCLNRLPYNWQGRPGDDGLAPKWDAVQERFDFSAYDRRVGPLLDGSLFAGSPRGPTPVEVLYLPLNENWPIPIDEGFTGGYWADEALSATYRARFVTAVEQWAAHVRARGWTGTDLEFFLNGKLQFKQDRWSRASSPWTFDEPVNTQDFVALAWYGRAFHEGVRRAWAQATSMDTVTSSPPPHMVFRCDISRPQWQRDILDGVLDVNVVGGALVQYQDLVRQRQQAGGQKVIWYGSANAVAESNLQPTLWCVQAWCLGADGVLPWQTLGGNGSWHKDDPEAIFYPGGPVGINGPVASLRLKSFRAGQQLVEMLNLWAQAKEHPRWWMAPWVTQRLHLRSTFAQAHAEDAGVMQYSATTAAEVEALRQYLGDELDHLAESGRLPQP